MTLNKPIRPDAECQELRQKGMVELIAGPGCGMKVKWPHPDRGAVIGTPQGPALYELEQGDATAHYADYEKQSA